MVHTLHILVFLLLIFPLSGCDNTTRVSATDSEDRGRKSHVNEKQEIDLAATVTMRKISFSPAKKLEIITWHDFIPQDIYDYFTDTYGTSIVPTFVESNEQMFDLLQNSPGKYDLLMPDDYMVEKLISAGLLNRLDHANIPNITYLDEDVRRLQYDRGLSHIIPLFRDSVGIAFHIDYVPGIPRNWTFIREQMQNQYLAYRVGIRKEMRLAMGMSLLFLGYSPNSINPEEIIEARDLLINSVEKHGVKFHTSVGHQNMSENEILLALAWNGNAARAMSHNPDVRFLLPDGKIIVSYNNIAISSKSTNKQAAELFIDYLLTPQVSARMTNYNFFPNCNPSSLPFVKKIVRNGPSYFFPSEGNRLFLNNLGDNNALYEDAWEKILQAKPPSTLVKLPLPKGGMFSGETQSPNFTDPSPMLREQ